MYTTTVVLGAAATTAGAVVLPNTGANHVVAIVSVISIAVGVVAMLTSAARLVAKKAYKA